MYGDLRIYNAAPPKGASHDVFSIVGYAGHSLLPNAQAHAMLAVITKVGGYMCVCGMAV